MKILPNIIILFIGVIPSLIKAQIKNLRFFGLWLGAGPQVNILDFRSTLIIPTGLPDLTLNDGVQAFWPGLEPSQCNSVFQNVITNGDTVGEWSQLPFYCCNPGVGLSPKVRVYAEDRVTNTFALNENTLKWYNTYTITPGAAGDAAGQKIFTNSFEFDPNTIAADHTTFGEQYTSALMTIELQGNSNWTWGPVEWRDILLRANTTETSWSNPERRPGLQLQVLATCSLDFRELNYLLYCTNVLLVSNNSITVSSQGSISYASAKA
ncbi:uncharacterized protein PAC_06015 [Phialocephala subalpina]|uniref:Uncharacterized protein n=1 Tax=Phialocephala subalpina TaxID=576137 RepID=A0A1L7WTM8_9HELO|nr:uncharacterized protein PAC_06015 [Phialocephala subalpina]